MANAGAAIAAKRRRIVKAFRDGAACSPEHARPLGELGVERSLVFQMLIRSGVVVAAAEDRFYLDEVAEALDRQKRRIRVIWLLAVGLALIATLLLIL